MAQTKDQQRRATKSRNSKPQTFTHHIQELRRRLFVTALVGIIVGSIVYYYNDFFVKLIMAPLGDQKLIYLTPVGGFSFIFMIATYVTMLLMLPVVLYQLYGFLKPAIPEHSASLSVKVAVIATVLMAAGSTFGYLFAVPGGLHFLSGFASEYVTASLTADAYLKFVLGYVFGIGLLFELPLLLLFWHWIHPLTPKQLLNSERYVIVGAFVAAAILSPTPDAFSQTVIAVPIIAVYQLGVVGVYVSIRRGRRERPAVLEPRSVVATQAQPVRPVLQPKVVKQAVRPRYQVPAKPKMMSDMKTSIKKHPQLIVKKPATQPLSAPRRLVVPQRSSRLISDFRSTRPVSLDTEP